MAKKKSLEDLDILIKRWRSRLMRAMRMVDKLEKQRSRIEAAKLKEQETIRAEKALKRKKAGEPAAV